MQKRKGFAVIIARETVNEMISLNSPKPFVSSVH